MAKLLTKEEYVALKPGAHVWAESVMDDGDPLEYEVVTDHGMVKGMASVGTRVVIGRSWDFEKDTQMRFWDSKPTTQEALTTPWFAKGR